MDSIDNSSDFFNDYTNDTLTNNSIDSCIDYDTSGNCLECNIENGYYPLVEYGILFCYTEEEIPEGYYLDFDEEEIKAML